MSNNEIINKEKSKNPLLSKALSVVNGEKVPVPPKRNQMQQSNMIAGETSVYQERFKIALELSRSDFVPSAYRGKPADVLMVSELAEFMKLPLFIMLQNIDVIKGKAGWKSSFVIALVNASRRFSSRLKFQYDGIINNDNWRCRAYAQEHGSSEVCYGAWVSIKMAKDEGWYSKDGSKWQTMPELMLMYRAAAFFGRVHCSDLLHGLQHTDELVDIETISEQTVKVSESMIPNNVNNPQTAYEHINNIEQTIEVEVEEPIQTQSKNTQKEFTEFDNFVFSCEELGFQIGEAFNTNPKPGKPTKRLVEAIAVVPQPNMAELMKLGFAVIKNRLFKDVTTMQGVI